MRKLFQYSIFICIFLILNCKDESSSPKIAGAYLTLLVLLTEGFLEFNI